MEVKNELVKELRIRKNLRRDHKNQSKPKMTQNFFTYLPTDMTMNILSRLPVLSIHSCKCVCKTWLDLVETREFANSHLSRSIPGLAVSRSHMNSTLYRFYEFVDELDPQYSERYCSEYSNLNFPHPQPIHSSVNGLLFMFDPNKRPHNLLICNPVTLDYIKLPPPQFPSFAILQLDTFGFGVSKITAQYKVIRISHKLRHNQEWDDHSECQVYTLGSGSWRSITPSGLLKYEGNSIGASLNGNFHWLVCDLRGSPWISCFDLETEVFSTFSSPCLHGHHSSRTMSVLEECLCLCDNSSDDEIVIWLMNEYGDDKSWTKKVVISKISPDDFRGVLCPIKVFKDGDILIATEGRSGLICYYNMTQTIEETGVIELNGYDCTSAVSYTPSFLSLATFTMENVVFF